MLKSKFDQKLNLLAHQIDFENLKFTMLSKTLDYEFLVSGTCTEVLSKSDGGVLTHCHLLKHTALSLVLLHSLFASITWSSIWLNTC